MPISRTNSVLDEIVPHNAVIEKLAGGLGFTEGPVWMRDGSLVFSDIPNNTMHRWTEPDGLSVFRKPSGFYGEGEPPGPLAGSNGLTLDSAGRVVICEHGNRRVTRLEPDGTVTVLADRFEGKRLNSPNDAVHKSDGALYFTDPPYGLAKLDDDPAKELAFNGLFRLDGSGLRLLVGDQTRPNGLAFSPDESVLYLANSDSRKRWWMRYEVRPDGALGAAGVFFDVTGHADPGSPDGMKIDARGNLYCTGPGGIWIFSPAGAHLGTIRFPEIPANCHWGDADARTLYVTARTSLYRIKLNIEGIRP